MPIYDEHYLEPVYSRRAATNPDLNGQTNPAERLGNVMTGDIGPWFGRAHEVVLRPTQMDPNALKASKSTLLYEDLFTAPAKQEGAVGGFPLVDQRPHYMPEVRDLLNRDHETLGGSQTWSSSGEIIQAQTRTEHWGNNRFYWHNPDAMRDDSPAIMGRPGIADSYFEKRDNAWQQGLERQPKNPQTRGEYYREPMPGGGQGDFQQSGPFMNFDVAKTGQHPMRGASGPANGTQWGSAQQIISTMDGRNNIRSESMSSYVPGGILQVPGAQNLLDNSREQRTPRQIIITTHINTEINRPFMTNPLVAPLNRQQV